LKATLADDAKENPFFCQERGKPRSPAKQDAGLQSREHGLDENPAAPYEAQKGRASARYGRRGFIRY
jgi:hypothetical protein